MASFDSEELVDFIRHQCLVNADDDGQCKKILQPPSRKAKPGGLPLNFRSAIDSDTSSGENSPCYLASVNCKSTYELIQERLRLRIQENGLSSLGVDDKAVKSNVTDAWPSTSNLEFFQCTDASYIPSSSPVKKSITALLLEKTDFLIRSDLAAYAKFVAPDIENGRKLLVFYPFAELESNGDKCFSLTIYAQREICISDLIGLCCYEYARYRKTNNIGSIAQYHLLMAEENGEVDRDLPPIDGHRSLDELGSCWSTIALEKRRSLDCSEKTNIIVYTVNSKRYEFLMDSLDVPLRWLRDEAVRKRIEDEGPDFLSDYPALREYILEPAKLPGVALDLNKPISSTACLEFLLMRINSSRGDFTLSRRSSFAQDHSQTSKIHRGLLSSSLKQRQCSDNFCNFAGTNLIHKEQSRISVTIIPASAVDIKDSSGNSIAFYSVEKIHRYKPNWTALLTIRTGGFELAPSQVDQTRKRSSIFLNSSPKTLYVRWDDVGGVEITDRSNLKRRVRIVWLAYRRKHQSEVLKTIESTGSIFSSTWHFDSDVSTENDELSRRNLYNDAFWKILQLEASVDDAWNITEKINTIIDDINSVVHQIYKYSNGGSKKPKKAAAKAFNNDAGAQFKGRNSSIRPMVRRLSHLAYAVTQ
uniref:Target of rapamycin complex 2 subunit MAPKAP1 n=1 Tax=Elaeophora elaphi TaxID=1147741 RepID=A0A0R3RL73_9BILA